MKKMKIEFDVAWDTCSETLNDVLQEVKRECDADSRVLVERGPAGGWPVVEFVVSEEKLDELITRLGYGDDLEWWREDAEEV